MTAFDGKATRDLEEAKRIDLQMARGAHQLSLGAVQGEGQRAGRACGHLQRGLAGAGLVLRIAQRVVDHRI